MSSQTVSRFKSPFSYAAVKVEVVHSKVKSTSLSGVDNCSGNLLVLNILYYMERNILVLRRRDIRRRCGTEPRARGVFSGKCRFLLNYGTIRRLESEGLSRSEIQIQIFS